MCDYKSVSMCKYTFAVSILSSKLTLWYFISPFCPFQRDLWALHNSERCDNLPKTLIFLKAVDKDVIAAQITPRGTKTVHRADYFESKQTGLCDVCWSEERRWEGRVEGSWKHSSGSTEVLLKIKAMKLDGGKTVLTSSIWSSAAVSWHGDSELEWTSHWH